MSPEESEEGLSELLGLFDVRGVPTVFDHFFPVTPPLWLYASSTVRIWETIGCGGYTSSPGHPGSAPSCLR